MSRMEQFAQVGDIRMHFQTEGHGEPMVLLMGFWGNLAWWPEPLLSYLRQHFQLILVDNRGAGLSERGTMPYKIKTLANDLALLLDHLGHASVHLFGVSMGGMIAQEFAVRYPQRVKRMVLANTQGGLALNQLFSRERLRHGLRHIRQVYAAPADFFLNLVFTPEFRASCPPDEWQTIMTAVQHRRMPGRTAREQLLAIVRWRSLHRLHQVNAPTLVLAGGGDFMVPAACSYPIAKELPNARLVCLKDQGHGMLYEAFNEIIPYLDEFFARPTPGDGAPLYDAGSIPNLQLGTAPPSQAKSQSMVQLKSIISI